MKKNRVIKGNFVTYKVLLMYEVKKINFFSLILCDVCTQRSLTGAKNADDQVTTDSYTDDDDTNA